MYEYVWSGYGGTRCAVGAWKKRTPVKPPTLGTVYVRKPFPVLSKGKRSNSFGHFMRDKNVGSQEKKSYCCVSFNFFAA